MKRSILLAAGMPQNLRVSVPRGMRVAATSPGTAGDARSRDGSRGRDSPRHVHPCGVGMSRALRAKFLHLVPSVLAVVGTRDLWGAER